MHCFIIPTYFLEKCEKLSKVDSKNATVRILNGSSVIILKLANSKCYKIKIKEFEKSCTKKFEKVRMSECYNIGFMKAAS